MPESRYKVNVFETVLEQFDKSMDEKQASQKAYTDTNNEQV